MPKVGVFPGTIRMAEETKSPTTGETPSSSTGLFSHYKSEQGRFVRMGAFWVLFFLGFYGCMRLSSTLDRFGDAMQKNWIDGNVPVLGVPLTLSVVIATAVFVAFSAWLFWFLNKPRSADFLIETEDELKKVTWPTFAESVDASLVVIATVVFLLIFVAGVDLGLGWFFGKFLFRR